MRDLIVVGPANWVIILDVDELITMRSSSGFLFPSLLFRNEGNIRNSASATEKRPNVCLGAQRDSHIISGSRGNLNLS